VPGCKVLRWERDWHAAGHPFLEPASYPPLSAALTSTHDTDTLAGWWKSASRHEREATLRLRFFQERGLVDATAPWSDHLRDAFLELACEAGSSELLMPIQDLFGWIERINVPGTVTSANWTSRLPWPADRLGDVIEATARARFFRALAVRTGRATP
jgi:4-alpha-glucanotransferase